MLHNRGPKQGYTILNYYKQYENLIRIKHIFLFTQRTRQSESLLPQRPTFVTVLEFHHFLLLMIYSQ